MADTSQGEGWWQASDGKWYPPKQVDEPVEAEPEPAPAPRPASSGNLSGGQLVGMITGIWGVVALLVLATDDLFDQLGATGKIDVASVPALTAALGLYWMTRK